MVSILSPHWGPKDPSGFQSILFPTLWSEGTYQGPVELVCLSISISPCLFVSLAGPPCHFLVIIRAARNCAQRMRPQAKVSNTLSGSIICLYSRPSSFQYNLYTKFNDTIKSQQNKKLFGILGIVPINDM